MFPTHPAPDATPGRVVTLQEAKMSPTLIKSTSDLAVPVLKTCCEGAPGTARELEVRESAHSACRTRDQRGLVTAEWAVGIIAAAGLAGVLIAVITSGPVQSALLKVILHFISAVADKF
jgi:Protein of unknown function (DUF4244)